MRGKLISLEEHNAACLSKTRDDPSPNGIACSNCDAELLDTDPLFTCTSDPPKKHIHCDNCEFEGYRLA